MSRCLGLPWAGLWLPRSGRLARANIKTGGFEFVCCTETDLSFRTYAGRSAIANPTKSSLWALTSLRIRRISGRRRGRGGEHAGLDLEHLSVAARLGTSLGDQRVPARRLLRDAIYRF